MNKDLSLVMRLYADTARFVGGLRTGKQGLKGFVDEGVSEVKRLGHSINSLHGRLASLGVGVGMGVILKDAASLDKTLSDLKNTTEAADAKIKKMRRTLFEASAGTGIDINELTKGVSALTAAGLSIETAQSVITPLAKAMAVYPTQAAELASALGVASQQFSIDLTDATKAQELLDKFAVAGSEGKAELENLPALFAQVGANAKAAGFDINTTLALLETLSLNTEVGVLGTLMDSTTRMFTMGNYKKQVSKATGISFYEDGSRRNPVAVLTDLKKQYDSLRSQQSKDMWFDKAFAGFDSETIKGLRSVFGDNQLEKLGSINRNITNAAGDIANKLPSALQNAVTASNRLRSTLRLAADDFARPILDVYTKVVNKAIDPQDKGGLDLTGKEMAIGAATVAGGAFAAAKIAGMIFGKGKGAGGAADVLASVKNLGGGVAIGQALSSIGVQPVYVVNMPDGGIGGSLATAADAAGDLLGGGKRFSKLRTSLALLRGAPLGAIPGMGAGAMASAGLALAGAGVAGYGVGTMLYDNLLAGTTFSDKLGEGIARAWAAVGSDTARAAINQRVTGKLDLNIKVDSEGRATVSPSGPVMLEPPTRTNPAATGRMLWGG